MVRKRIPILPAFTLKTPNLDPGSNLKAQTPTTPASKKKNISSSQYTTIFLHDWWLVKPQSKGLAVGGVASLERLGERVIFSSPIAKRHETNVLETQDGITFIVTGFINKSRTYENGFSVEVCRHFLFGFPHDWEEYISYGVGKQHNAGNTGLVDDSSTCPLMSAGEISDLLTDKGDLNCRWLLNKFLNDAVGTSPPNISQQSEPANKMECNVTMNTKEHQGQEDTSLGTSKVQDDDNIENGVSNVILETQDEIPSPGFQCGMKMNSLKPSGDPSHKRTDETASEREKKYPGSSARKQKISEDVDNYNCRRITRSISKMSCPAAVKKKMSCPVAIKKKMSCPVRRSPRLSNLKK